MFQSHAGSIEALSLADDSFQHKSGFNPTLVRLRLARSRIRVGLLEVSIPRWFD